MKLIDKPLIFRKGEIMLTIGQFMTLLFLIGLAAATFIKYSINRSNNEDSFPMRQCHFCMEVVKETIEVRQGSESKESCFGCFEEAALAGFKIP